MTTIYLVIVGGRVEGATRDAQEAHDMARSLGVGGDAIAVLTGNAIQATAELAEFARDVLA